MSDPSIKTSTEELVLIELRRIIRSTQLSSKTLARESGITPSQLVALQLLKEQGEMTATRLATSMHLTQATVTALLDRLEEREWISRQRHDSDRRRIRILLTPAGTQQLAAAPQSLHDKFLTEFRQLQAWEQTSILAALQRVGVLLQAASFDAAPVLDAGRIDRPADRE